MRNNKVLIYAAILFLLLCYLQFDSCKKDRKIENLLTQISKYELNNQQFSVKRMNDSSTIAQQNQTILTQQEAAKLGLIKLSGEIVKLQAQVSQSMEVRYESVFVPFVPTNFADTTSWHFKFKNGDTSKAVIDSFKANSVIVPKKFTLNDKWLSLGGVVTKTGVTVDSMKIPNKSTVTLGWKRSGFLKLFKTPVVEIQNSNPYMTVSEMNNVVIEKKKGLLQKPTFWAGLGVVAGYILKSKL